MVNHPIDWTPDSCPVVFFRSRRCRVCPFKEQVCNGLLLIPSRGSYREGERREHHWEDLLASHSLDPEQVKTARRHIFLWFITDEGKTGKSPKASKGLWFTPYHSYVSFGSPSFQMSLTSAVTGPCGPDLCQNLA